MNMIARLEILALHMNRICLVRIRAVVSSASDISTSSKMCVPRNRRALPELALINPQEPADTGVMAPVELDD